MKITNHLKLLHHPNQLPKLSLQMNKKNMYHQSEVVWKMSILVVLEMTSRIMKDMIKLIKTRKDTKKTMITMEVEITTMLVKSISQLLIIILSHQLRHQWRDKLIQLPP